MICTSAVLDNSALIETVELLVQLLLSPFPLKKDTKDTPQMVSATLHTFRTLTLSPSNGTDRINTTAEEDWKMAVLADTLES